jgi:predicted phosphodiesterase
VTRLGRSVALFADVHAATRILNRALLECRAAGVETVALLGDLFDRDEQADRCVEALEGWPVIGVYGNHEREAALAAATGELALRAETVALLTSLEEELSIDDVLFTHEVASWGHDDPYARLFGRESIATPPAGPRVTFTGHTHFRQARDERGPLDIARGELILAAGRRYLINPGPLLTGQFAIWDRESDIVRFRHVQLDG